MRAHGHARLLLLALVLAVSSLHLRTASAGQAPGASSSPDIPISSRDRLYLSLQGSNAVSVLDPATNKLLGLIQLGGKLQDSLAATYRQQSIVHGMGASPDGTTLAVVCVGSNAIVFVRTSDSSVKHIAYVGRAPHEAVWTPNGKEVWVAIRGEDYIQILDGDTYAPTRRVKVPHGPGMSWFSPDGRYVYICSSFTPETVILSTSTYQIVGRVKQASPFCPNIAASPDGSQVWMTLKDSGRVQVFGAVPPFKPIALLETGPVTNHVNYAVVPGKGQFAYVTVGGLRQVKVFTTGPKPALVATIDTGDNPHGLFPSGDGSRMYVGLQVGNAVAVIDTATNKLLQTIDVGGQAPMALWYVPRALPAAGMSSTSSASANLVPAAAAREAARALHFELVSAGADSTSSSSSQGGGASGRVVSSLAVNSQGFLDAIEGVVTGLKPGQMYVLALAGSRDGSGDVDIIASFKANPDGAAGVAVLGPFRHMLLGSGSSASMMDKMDKRAIVNEAAARGDSLRLPSKQARYFVVALLVSSDGANSRVGSIVQMQQPAAAA